MIRFLFGLLFWCVYFPFVRLFVLFLFWNDKVEGRERFEKKNKFEYLAQSFHDGGITADLCFEFSSEGEYQQVAPLIDDALKAGKKIELVFFSPSVEKTVMKLASLYPSQIRYLRYPFVRLFPFIPRRSFISWTTAKTLVMVRYDLFPEFLLWAMHPNHKLKMVWMTFKKENERGKGPSMWKKLFLRWSRDVVYARSLDQEDGLKLNVPGITFDFRIEQIRRRMEKRDEKFKTHFPLYPDFKKELSKFPKKIILGNAWPSDLFLLKNLPQDIFLMIVPHELSESILTKFHVGLRDLGRDVYELSDQTKSWEEGSTILVNKKGILCELYSDFSHAYVGGGFEGSIHSVLEPLVAGSDRISCGPQHHRSTEYDVALHMKKISEVNTPEQFLAWLNDHHNPEGHDRMKSLMDGYESAREIVISC